MYIPACKPPGKSSALTFDPYSYDIQKKVVAENGAVVSAHPLPAKQVLKY
jgi:hypothetical protein